MPDSKPGTRIEVLGSALDGRQTREPARIVRTTAEMRPLPPGYLPVRFDADGAVSLIHSSRRVAVQ